MTRTKSRLGRATLVVPALILAVGSAATLLSVSTHPATAGVDRQPEQQLPTWSDATVPERLIALGVGVGELAASGADLSRVAALGPALSVNDAGDWGDTLVRAFAAWEDAESAHGAALAEARRLGMTTRIANEVAAAKESRTSARTALFDARLSAFGELGLVQLLGDSQAHPDIAFMAASAAWTDIDLVDRATATTAADLHAMSSAQAASGRLPSGFDAFGASGEDRRRAVPQPAQGPSPTPPSALRTEEATAQLRSLIERMVAR